jgi:arylsulfatase A
VPQDSLDEFKGKFPEKPFVNPSADAQKGYSSQPTPRAAFAAMVTRMDRDIGRLLEKIKALGIDNDTIVFFTSDNGPHKEGGADPEFFDSNGPLRGIKRDLTEGGIRVPMIVRWPGKVPAGTVSDDVRAHWDFLPTVAGLVEGIPFTEGVDGESFAPLLLGKPIMARLNPVYWEFFERGFDQAIRVGDWKGIRNGLGEPLQLYNLKTDVGEAVNVAAEQPEIVAMLEERMKSSRVDSERWVPRKVKK